MMLLAWVPIAFVPILSPATDHGLPTQLAFLRGFPKPLVADTHFISTSDFFPPLPWMTGSIQLAQSQA